MEGKYPWEGDCPCLYGTVLRVDGKYRVYGRSTFETGVQRAGLWQGRSTRNFDEEPVWTMPERDKLAVKPTTWKDGRSARELAGRRVRLFFEVRDAHLYSFRAGGSSFRAGSSSFRANGS